MDIAPVDLQLPEEPEASLLRWTPGTDGREAKEPETVGSGSICVYIYTYIYIHRQIFFLYIFVYRDAQT